MSYEKTGKFWPKEQDRQPLSVGFWVPRSPLVREDDDKFASGSAHLVVTETPDKIQSRFEAQFPLYRVATFGKRVLKIGEGR